MNSTMLGVYRKLKRICHTAKNVDLTNLASIKAGGVADVVVYPATIEEIFKILDIVENNVPYIVLGNMTNVLISNYHGVIIVIGPQFANTQVVGNIVIADGGCALSKLCAVAQLHGLSGMEELFGIPGTVGGAVAMNAGAFGRCMAQIVHSVLAIKNGKVKHFNLKDCHFGYRNSAFKDCIILRVEVVLTRGDLGEIKRNMALFMQKRIASQPLELPSFGSTFKNPPNNFAGRLIEDSGLKGYISGGAMVSVKHSNFIVNNNHASVSDIKNIISYIQKRVLEKYEISLELEVKFIGEDT